MFAFKEDGNPKDLPLVFLHGFLGCKDDWKRVIFYLKDNFFCISIDLPGHGDSAITSKTSFDDFANSLKKIFKAKNLKNPVLIGYSMGGRIAHYVHNYYLINQLCICIGSHLGLTKQDEVKKRKAWNKSILSQLENNTIDEFLKFWYSQKIFDLFRESKIYLDALNYRKDNNKKILKKAFLAFCVTKQKILPPDHKTFFIVGQKDDKYVKYYQKIKCPYHVVENASHVMHLENPQGLAEKIKEILHANKQLVGC